MSGNQIQSTVPRPVYGKHMQQHRNKISQQVNNESGLLSNNKLLAKSRHAVLPVKQTFPITHPAQTSLHGIIFVFAFVIFISLMKCSTNITTTKRVISLFLHMGTHLRLTVLKSSPDWDYIPSKAGQSSRRWGEPKFHFIWKFHSKIKLSCSQHKRGEAWTRPFKSKNKPRVLKQRSGAPPAARSSTNHRQNLNWSRASCIRASYSSLTTGGLMTNFTRWKWKERLIFLV